MESTSVTPIRRRTFIQLAAGFGLAPGIGGGRAFGIVKHHHDDALLDDLSQRCFQYFADAMDPETGICMDLIHGNPATTRRRAISRAEAPASPALRLRPCASAPTAAGFRARKPKTYVRHCLQSYTNGKVPPEHGWFYHFIDMHTGQRWKDVEISTSDCIWLLAGSLTCRQYFHEDHEIGDLATLLYSRYDFQWMTNGDGKLLSHGWKPEGFLKARYEKYCQLAAMYLLGIGAPTHPLPPDAWYAWGRDPNSYGSYNYIGTSLLWTYQYPFAWFDFRGKRETTGRQKSTGSRTARSPRARIASGAIRILPRNFPTTRKTIWGITSSSSPKGYKAWGGPPKHSQIDGSVVPAPPAARS